MKKARKWLDNNGIEYKFHDYKKQGISKTKLQSWCKSTDWETLLNRRGTTWRKLDAAIKENVTKSKAVMIMLENPSMIKRPVIEVDDKLVVGFAEEDYIKTFK
jgi:arsenate reductase